MTRPKPTTVVLGLVCAMYMITYVDRVNLSTAASDIGRELSLSNTEVGLAFSAFGYPYLLFQVFGGWVGDRFGPRRTLFACGLVWTAATLLIGLSGGLAMLVAMRVLLGIGEGATFPVATRAMQSWTPKSRRRIRAGDYARVFPLRQRAHPAHRRVADHDRHVARVVCRAGLLQFHRNFHARGIGRR